MLTAILPKTGSGIGAYLSKAPPAIKYMYFKMSNVAMYCPVAREISYKKIELKVKSYWNIIFNLIHVVCFNFLCEIQDGILVR